MPETNDYPDWPAGELPPEPSVPYPDVHYHLARTLDELGRSDEAMLHWQTFLTHAPDSPWAETARDRLRDT